MKGLYSIAVVPDYPGVANGQPGFLYRYTGLILKADVW